MQSCSVWLNYAKNKHSLAGETINFRSKNGRPKRKETNGFNFCVSAIKSSIVTD